MADSDSTGEGVTRGTKICKKCGCDKPLSSYAPKRADGKVCLTGACRDCINASQNSRYAKSDEQRDRQVYSRRNALLLLQSRRECKDCAQVLPVDQFAVKGKGISCSCKACKAVQMRDKYANNVGNLRTRVQEHGRKRRLTHGPILNEQKRVYVAANRQKVTDRQNEWAKRKLREDALFALKKRLRSLMSNAFRSVKVQKSACTEAILGCTFEQFKNHVERQFQPGMSWANRTDWHLDHVVPLATAITEEDVVRLNHFTNYRPLWAADNIAKGAKVVTLL